MNRTTIIVVAAVGVVGAAVALLLTTKRGKQLTKDIADQTGEWRDYWTKMPGSPGDKLLNLSHQVGDKVSHLTADARKKILAILDGNEMRNRPETGNPQGEI